MTAEGCAGTFGHLVPPRTWGSTLVMPSKAEDVTNSKVEVGCRKLGAMRKKRFGAGCLSEWR